MKQDGWVADVDGIWILRFLYDWDSWDQNPKVLTKIGRIEVNGPPLLKSRKRMRRAMAIKLWKELLSTGWRRVEPHWD